MSILVDSSYIFTSLVGYPPGGAVLESVKPLIMPNYEC